MMFFQTQQDDPGVRTPPDMDRPVQETNQHPRPHTHHIKSFMRRGGRLTASQNRAMKTLWPKYGLDPCEPLDIAQAFERDTDTVLEIGFGNGGALAELAQSHPELNYIGIDVHTPGVGHLLLEIEKRGLTNVKIYRHDAVDVLHNCIADQALTKLQLFFPDPWHKKRHHKRRIVQTKFTALVHRKLKQQGIWHIATDWEDYAVHCLDILEPFPGFDNLAGTALFMPRPEHRPMTRFEQRGHRLGHNIRDLMYRKVSCLLNPQYGVK